MAYVISENTTQRTLKPSQVALAIGKMRPFQERMAKERQRTLNNVETAWDQKSPSEDQGRVNTILAEKAGVSSAMMKRKAHHRNSACDPKAQITFEDCRQKIPRTFSRLGK